MKLCTFTVFEHQTLVAGHSYNGNEFTREHRDLLESAYRDIDFPFFSLIRHGVRFCEYVGVFRVGRLQVEVLPKAGKGGDQDQWRRRLIDMLRTVGAFNIRTPSASALKLKPNSILELYCQLFVDEVEQILHRGLIKRYRRTAGNASSLKGALHFARHLDQNLTHQERFYVRYSVYTNQHSLNAVLGMTVRLLSRISTNPALRSRIGALQLSFPEMADIKVSDAWFEKIQYDRKSESYRNALGIARLLLLNYHPDVTSGTNNVLALMFDMNILWEKFVCVTLKRFLAKARPGWTVEAQTKTLFWRNVEHSRGGMKMQPDIIVNHGCARTVLDSKWKNLDDGMSQHDLRQMYAYSKFHDDARTVLVYPGDVTLTTIGRFMDRRPNADTGADAYCSLVTIAIDGTLSKWQDRIGTWLLEQEPVQSA